MKEPTANEQELVEIKIMQKTGKTGRALPARVKGKLRWHSENLVGAVRNSLQPATAQQLIILDDIFPHLLSPFRIAEYNAYLRTFPRTTIYSTHTSFFALGETRGFPEVVAEYETSYPHFAGRVFKFDRTRRLRADLAYTMFLQNAFTFIDSIEKNALPFVMTLYPGGGFRLNEAQSDAQLARVCASPLLKKVIVTQKVTRDYLLDKKLLVPEQIEFIYGGVFPSHCATGAASPHQERKTFDICFVAHKYMPQGLDKGYDVFIATAKLLAALHDEMRFHVVGPFDESDIAIDGLENKIIFHGVRRAEFFPEFYREMDAILSPNASFVLRPGAFDGFPTGCCIEAGLCGVAVFCSDDLQQNVAFKDGEEIVIVARDAAEISRQISAYYQNPARLCELCEQGQKAFARVFDVEAQMAPRFRILRELMPQTT